MQDLRAFASADQYTLFDAWDPRPKLLFRESFHVTESRKHDDPLRNPARWRDTKVTPQCNDLKKCAPPPSLISRNTCFLPSVLWRTLLANVWNRFAAVVYDVFAATYLLSLR